MHSPEPLSLSEILNTMPTDKSIAAIYKKMSEKQKLEKSLSIWGMLSSGATSIRWVASMINGISYQHVLSYNPHEPYSPSVWLLIIYLISFFPNWVTANTKHRTNITTAHGRKGSISKAAPDVSAVKS